MPSVGVDLSSLLPDVDYPLEALSEVFRCSVQTLRKAIKAGELTARKKGKLYWVKGKEAVRWWNS